MATASSSKAVGESDEFSYLTTSTSSEASAKVDSIRQVEHSYPKLPLWRKLTYGVGSMLYSMTNVVIGFYLQIFLLEVAILDPVFVSVIVFVGRVWDALTDPVIGYLSSRTKTRLGRLRPWVLSSLLPVAVTFFFLWFVPHWSSGAKFAYYFLIYLLLQASATCFHVPYTALIMHLTDCNKQRDSATLYRMCFEVFGTFLGSLIQGMSLVIFQAPSLDSCAGDGSSERTYSVSLERGYRYGALTISVIVVLCGLITFFGVKEQKEHQHVNKGLSFFKGIRVTLGYKPYAYLVIMYMLSWLAVQIVQANLALYVKYTLGLGEQFQYIIIVVLVCSILSLPLWQLVIVKVGKKTAYFAGAWVFMIVLFAMLFLDNGSYIIYVVYPLAAFSGVGIGSMYLLPWSMLPDVVDKAFVEQGVRREELFYSFYVFFSKFGAGVSLGISTLILKAGGFNEEQCLQLWSVPLTLKLLISTAPILLVMASLIFHKLYPIDENVRMDIRGKIAESRTLPVRVHYGIHDSQVTDSILPGSTVRNSTFQYTPSASTEKLGTEN
jgi:Na+/melibiose symporter-like transporter